MLTGSQVSIESIVGIAVAAGQKAIISASVQLNASGEGGVGDTATLQIYDGTPASPIDTYEATVDTDGSTTVSWTLELSPTTGTHTFGVSAEEGAPGDLTVPTNGARIVVQLVNA